MTTVVDANARNEARDAAGAAGVEITTAESLEQLQQVREVMDAVWGPSVVPPLNLMRAMSFAGSGLLLAYRGDTPVAFSLGILGWGGGTHFHSHQVGVVPGERSSGVGFALKMAQRVECLDNGVTEMRWTYDPLLKSNASFNLVRLGAHIISFIPNCYGVRNDNFNTGDTTDRVKVSWRLDAPVGGVKLVDGDTVAMLIETDARVARSAAAPREGSVIPVPDAYHELRDADPDLGAQWRQAIGVAISDVLSAGLEIIGVNSLGYVVGKS